MALVLLIVGLLASVFLPATNTMLDNSRRKETRATLETVEQAMVRFVVVNGRLPCPANGALPAGNAEQGLEQPHPGTAACMAAALTNGVVPWRTLGLAQDDVTDATRWALEQGITSPGRICIYGASYGAYAAMMGLVREPDLYACGIGNVGLYDLVKMYKERSATRYGRDYFDTGASER